MTGHTLAYPPYKHYMALPDENGKVKKFYLGGPMTGIKEFNFPEFDRVSELLRRFGLDVLSAHEVDHGESEGTRGSLPYMQYIKTNLTFMLQCDAVIFLPGWQRSRGCGIEFKLARLLEMKRYAFIPKSPASDPRLQEIQ